MREPDLQDHLRALVCMRLVAFGSYLVYFNVRGGLKGACVTAQEAAHLGAVTPEAEPIALRLLAANAEKWFGRKLDEAAVPFLPKFASVDELGLRMFKDVPETGRDVYGSDGVIFVPRDSEDHVDVHCVQLKLGKGEIKEPEVDKIFNRWAITESGKEANYQTRFKLDPDKSSFVYHLVTTRGLQQATRDRLIELCRKNNMAVKIHGKLELRKTGTWPEDVRALHPMFK